MLGYFRFVAPLLNASRVANAAASLARAKPTGSGPRNAVAWVAAQEPAHLQHADRGQHLRGRQIRAGDDVVDGDEPPVSPRIDGIHHPALDVAQLQLRGIKEVGDLFSDIVGADRMPALLMRASLSLPDDVVNGYLMLFLPGPGLRVVTDRLGRLTS